MNTFNFIFKPTIFLFGYKFTPVSITLILIPITNNFIQIPITLILDFDISILGESKP